MGISKLSFIMKINQYSDVSRNWVCFSQMQEAVHPPGIYFESLDEYSPAIQESFDAKPKLLGSEWSGVLAWVHAYGLILSNKN